MWAIFFVDKHEQVRRISFDTLIEAAQPMGGDALSAALKQALKALPDALLPPPPPCDCDRRH